jgi:hypothetical protein
MKRIIIAALFITLPATIVLLGTAKASESDHVNFVDIPNACTVPEV